MKYIAIKKTGAQETALTLSSCALPTYSENQLLIKVAAAGVNHADLFQAEGLYPPPAGASDIIGLEVSGTVVECGANVSGFQAGDPVCALLEGGGYAEYAVANAAQVLPVPKNVNLIDAAGLPEAYFTVWSNLFHHAELKRGESVLIHGGASGIGTAAIQLLHAMDFLCHTTAGSDEKCRKLEALGATKAINYHKEDFVYAIKEDTDGQGINVVLDMVGGDYFQRNMKVLAAGGRLISIALLQGGKTNINFASLLLKNLTIKGTTLRDKPTTEKAQLAEDLKTHAWPLFEQGKLMTVTDKIFALEEADAAHDYMRSRTHIGKIILQID